MKHKPIKTIHLQGINTFFDEMPTTGNLRKKRISAKLESQFPRRFRNEYQTNGAISTVRAIQLEFNCNLSEAWTKLKGMINSHLDSYLVE